MGAAIHRMDCDPIAEVVGEPCGGLDGADRSFKRRGF
jgi:hypothetical protein